MNKNLKATLVAAGAIGAIALAATLTRKVSATTLGDVNSDGVIDASDYIIVTRMVNGENNPVTGLPYSDTYKALADVNGDGVVDQDDLDTIEAMITNTTK